MTDIWVSLSELDAIMDQIAYDGVPYDNKKNDLENFLSEREARVREMQERFADYPDAPTALIKHQQDLSNSALDYARNFAADVLLRISEYRQQLSALERGDLDAYLSLISEQADNTSKMVRAESELVKLNQANQPPTSPEWFIQEAIIQSNNILADFLDYVNQFDSLSEEDAELRIRQMRQSLRKNTAAVTNAIDALENFRAQINKEKKQDFVSVIAFLEVNEQTIDVERRVLNIMQRYYHITEHYNAPENALATASQLDEIAVEVETTLNERTELSFTRQQAALAMVKELSEH